MSDCGVVILAAGASSRMGKAKPLLKLSGVSLVRRCAMEAVAAECGPVFVVAGAGAEEIAEEVSGLNVTVLQNPNWHNGIGTSIRVGVNAALDESESVAIVLCDQPRIGAAAILKLVQARETTGRAIAAAQYAGTLGTPAVFGREMFAELLSLGDDEGGKTILRRYAKNVIPVPIPEAAVDLDTPEDFDRMKADR